MKSQPAIRIVKYNSFPQLVSVLKDEINRSYLSLPVRTLGEQITEGTGLDFDQKIIAVSNFLTENSTFNRDPTDWEYLQIPSYLAARLLRGEHISGDCEDLTMLTLAVLKSLGIPGYMVFVAKPGSRSYSHVFAVAESPVTKRLFQIDMQKVNKVFLGSIEAVAA